MKFENTEVWGFEHVKWNGEWWYDARTYNERVKLIAWKEIAPPKEIKEND